LCLAYCRTKNEKFFDFIQYFRDEPNETLKDYYFLLGFYYRNNDKMGEAERNFLDVLKIDENHSRTKRELVNVYLRMGEYKKALNWASDNYYQFRTNIFHIQAYFTCLIKEENLNNADIEMLEELLESAAKSLDRKAEDIHREMQAEFDFYINDDVKKAISALQESLKINANNYFAFRALLEIYKNKNMFKELEGLMKQYPNLIEPEFE